MGKTRSKVQLIVHFTLWTSEFVWLSRFRWNLSCITYYVYTENCFARRNLRRFNRAVSRMHNKSSKKTNNINCKGWQRKSIRRIAIWCDSLLGCNWQKTIEFSSHFRPLKNKKNTSCHTLHGIFVVRADATAARKDEKMYSQRIEQTHRTRNNGNNCFVIQNK